MPAIEGHVPDDMVRTFRAFLEFCYLVRRDILSEDSLAQVQDAITRFHQYRVIFESTGVRPDGFSLPRQHSIMHYPKLIRMFGAPNGLCSSMTEAKHIKAVKEPWRRSSRYEPLGQMLLSNQRIDKLANARIDFTSRGMLDGSVLLAAIQSYCAPPLLPLDDISKSFILDHLHPPDDTQDSNSSDEPTASSSTIIDIDEPSETWPVNDPSAVAEVMLAKTPRPSIPIFRFLLLFLTCSSRKRVSDISGRAC